MSDTPASAVDQQIDSMFEVDPAHQQLVDELAVVYKKPMHDMLMARRDDLVNKLGDALGIVKIEQSLPDKAQNKALVKNGVAAVIEASKRIDIIDAILNDDGSTD